MRKRSDGRNEFREWVDKHPDPSWPLMPLTHISKGLIAKDIINDELIRAEHCAVFDEPLAYFFYGRPAYRVGGDAVIKSEAACPFCFIFDSALITKAKYIHAFDTGAFEKRLYKHVMEEEIMIEDYSLGTDTSRPNKIVSAVFTSMDAYLDADTTKIAPPSEMAKPWEFLATAYLQLLTSSGRNEPDDRICSIEVTVDDDVPLGGNLKAVIVPHTHWQNHEKAPWLEKLEENGVIIAPYKFVPGRHPEHYHALLECAARDIYEEWKLL